MAMGDLSSAQSALDDKERALEEVRNQYQAALADKQRLMDAADTCRRKMQAAATLINGLAGEKVRWTEQSQAFKHQLGQ